MWKNRGFYLEWIFRVCDVKIARQKFRSVRSIVRAKKKKKLLNFRSFRFARSFDETRFPFAVGRRGRSSLFPRGYFVKLALCVLVHRHYGARQTVSSVIGRAEHGHQLAAREKFIAAVHALCTNRARNIIPMSRRRDSFRGTRKRSGVLTEGGGRGWG